MKNFKGDWNGIWTYDPKKPLGDPGGFGTVYRGEAEDGTPIAVKVIPSALPSGRQLHPLLQEREAAIAKTLRDNPSAHLIQILDVAKVGRNVLLVMELAEGSLASRLPDFSEPAELIAVLKDIATGLYELHQAGIIHRDLKPSNVLFVDGKWKLADFGIARDESIGTASPTFLGWGTFAYMAPETWEGRSPTIKTDLYALGCMAYEIIAGTPPFPGPDEESYRRQHEQIAAPELDTTVNPTLRSLVGRLLSKDPADRPGDAGAVVESLDRVTIAPPTMVLRQLAQLSAEHASERAAEAAERAAERMEAERREQLWRQALSDLREICEGGASLLQQALSGITLQASPLQYRFDGEDAALMVAVWDGYRSPVSDDTLVAAGDIQGRNRRGKGARLANFVYEDEAGTLRWRLYRFYAQGGLRRYDLGPTDHAHGLDRRQFEDLNERSYMIRPITHIWNLTHSRFAPESIMMLFTEAMALPGEPPQH